MTTSQNLTAPKSDNTGMTGGATFSTDMFKTSQSKSNTVPKSVEGQPDANKTEKEESKE